MIKAEGFSINIMPVPREITASCGISAKLEVDEIDSIIKLASEEELKVGGYFHVELKNGKKTYHKSI